MAGMNARTYQDVIDFWFDPNHELFWFEKNTDFDAAIKKNFEPLISHALNNELVSWRDSPKGRLAEILVLDQIPRNIYRNDRKSFMGDRKALELAKVAVELKIDQDFKTKEKSFLYLPFMHSEDLIDHKIAAQLYSQPGLEFNLKYENLHVDILKKFGRYPHRNDLLGRTSTPQEVAFLKGPNSSF